MKRKLLFISGLMLVTAGLFAQAPNFTSSYYPHPGSTAILQPSYIADAPLYTGGTAQTWNYTGLTDSGSTSSQTFVAPSSTPSYWASIYQNANVAEGSNSAGYLYTLANSNSWVILGYAGTSPGDTLKYSTPETIFEYPFTYQSKFANTFAANSASTANGHTGTDTRTGTDTFSADGYGTVELPGGSNHVFTNVLRAVLIQNYRDIFSLDGTPYDTIYERVSTVDYFWASNSTQPILSISNVSETEYGITLTGSSVSFYPDAATGINDINPLVENLNVFPNPSYSQTILSLSLKETSPIIINVINILGQKVKTIENGQADAGNHLYTIETDDLAKGIYMINVEVNGSIAGVRKLEIE